MTYKLIMRQYGDLIRMGVITFIALIGFLLGVIPFAQKTLAVYTETNALKTQISMLKAKLATLEVLDENLLRGYALTLGSTIPPDKSLATIMTTVDNVSAQTGVTLADLTLTKAGALATASAEKLSVDERKLGASILPVSVRVAGTYESVQAFLATIGNVRRLFHVQTVALNFGEGSTVGASVLLNTYYNPYPTTIGHALDPISDISDDDRAFLSKLSALPLASEIPQSTQSGVVTVGKSDPFSY